MGPFNFFSEKEQKKNFIKENMKQLKFIQGKPGKEPKLVTKPNLPRLSHASAEGSLGAVKSSPSNKSGKVSLNVAKTSSTNSRKKHPDVRIKKGDMAEFLKRKEYLRQSRVADEPVEEDVQSVESLGRLRDVGCQTIESNLAQKLEESTKLTMLYPKKEDDADAKLKASGDSGRHRSALTTPHTPRRAGDEPGSPQHGSDHPPRTRLNAILERKDNKDPYLPSGTCL